MMQSPTSSNLLWISYCIFFISVVFFISDWFFLIFSVCVEGVIVFVHSPQFSEHLYDHYFEVFTSALFSSFSEVLSCSFVWNIFFCLTMFVDIRLSQLGFLVLKAWPYVKGVLWGQKCNSSSQQNQVFQGCPLCGLQVQSCSRRRLLQACWWAGLVTSVVSCETWLWLLWVCWWVGLLNSGVRATVGVGDTSPSWGHPLLVAGPQGNAHVEEMMLPR